MKCIQAQHALQLKTLNALSDIESARLETHLAQCEPCRSYSSELLALAKGVAVSCAASGVTPPELERFQRVVHDELERTRTRRVSLPSLRAVWATAAGFALIVSAGAYWRTSRNSGLAESWRVERVRVAETSVGYAPAFAGAQAYIVRGSSEGDMLAALDIATGREQWVSPLASGGHLAADDQSVYTIADEEHVSGALVALDAASGKRRWIAKPDAPGITAGVVAGARAVLWARASTLTALGSDDGRERWRFVVPDGYPLSRPVCVLDRALVAGGTAVLCLDMLSGKAVWSCELDSAPSLLAVPHLSIDNNRLYVAHRSGGTHGSVTCIDASTGTRVWQRDGIDAFHLTASGGRVFARGTSIAALDARSGTVLWRTAAAGCSPVICLQGAVIFADASRADAFTVLDAANGTVVSSLNLPNACAGLIDAGGMGLFSGNDGVMRAFDIRRLVKHRSIL